MFLGTPRYWWIITLAIFVAALVLVGTDVGGDWGTVIGILMLFLAMILFAASPMRRRSQPESAVSRPSPTGQAPVQETPPKPRPDIAGRDASEV